MVHTTIGLYANGSYKVNGVTSENLAAHIAYNLQMRPGRAFIVDGSVLNPGYPGSETCKEFIAKHPDIKREKDTQPYV